MLGCWLCLPLRDVTCARTSPAFIAEFSVPILAFRVFTFLWLDLNTTVWHFLSVATKPPPEPPAALGMGARGRRGHHTIR